MSRPATRVSRQLWMGQRRHGSNVPGPLEAGRRLNKRRRTNLASGGFRDTVEPALLFGAGFPKSEPAVSLPPPPVNVDQLISRLFLQPPPPSKSIIVNIEEVLTARLKRATTVDDLQGIVSDLSIDMSLRPDLSEAFFTHLLETSGGIHRGSIEEIQTFLSDPSLNIPASKNFAVSVEWLTANPTETAVIRYHVGFLGKAVGSGSLGLDELSAIVGRIPSIKTMHGTLKDSASQLSAFYVSLWHNTVASPSFRIEDANPSAWLDAVLTEDIATQDSLGIARDIIKRSPGSEIPAKYCTTYVLQLLRLANPEESHPIDWGELGTYRFSNNIKKLITKFESITKLLSMNDLATCIMDVAKALTFRSSDWRNRQACLAAWLCILQRTRRAKTLLLGTYLLRDFEATQDSPELRSSLALEQERCVLYIWIVSALGFHTARTKPCRESRERITTCLLDNLQSNLSPGSPGILFSLAGLVESLRARGLPDAHIVLHSSFKCWYRKIADRPYDLSNHITQILQLLEPDNHPVTKVLNKYQHKSGLYAPHPVFYQMSQSVDVTSRRVIEEIIDHVDTPSGRRAVLLNVLWNQIGVKVALALSDERKWKNRFRISDTSGTGYWTADGRFIPNPAACLQTFNTLVLIFAFSPKLRAKVSWELTYQCYLFMRNNHAPVKPMVARALYHAGIVRYREEGRTVPRAIVDVVREAVLRTEGREAAAKMMSAL